MKIALHLQTYESKNKLFVEKHQSDRHCRVRSSNACFIADLTVPANTGDGFADQLRDVITTLLDKFAPLHAGVRRRPKSSSWWLSREAVTAKRDRRRLERR